MGQEYYVRERAIMGQSVGISVHMRKQSLYLWLGGGLFDLLEREKGMEPTVSYVHNDKPRRWYPRYPTR